MDRIYDQAKDKNVSAIVIYGKDNDEKAYVDADCTTKYHTDALKDAFLKRAIIKIGDKYFIPIAFSYDMEIGVVTYAKAGSTSGTAATATLSSVIDGILD